MLCRGEIGRAVLFMQELGATSLHTTQSDSFSKGTKEPLEEKGVYFLPNRLRAIPATPIRPVPKSNMLVGSGIGSGTSRAAVIVSLPPPALAKVAPTVKITFWLSAFTRAACAASSANTSPEPPTPDAS